jgi:hypothetical protein
MLAAAALACAGTLAGYAAARADTWTEVAAALGGAAALALGLAALLRRAGPVPWTLLSLGALYAATLRGDALDGWSIAYGAGLLLAAELAYAAIGRERLVRAEPAVVLRQAAGIGTLVLASRLAGLGGVTVAGLRVSEGLPLAAAGAAAAVCLLLLLSRLARG